MGGQRKSETVQELSNRRNAKYWSQKITFTARYSAKIVIKKQLFLHTPKIDQKLYALPCRYSNNVGFCFSSGYVLFRFSSNILNGLLALGLMNGI